MEHPGRRAHVTPVMLARPLAPCPHDQRGTFHVYTHLTWRTAENRAPPASGQAVGGRQPKIRARPLRPG